MFTERDILVDRERRRELMDAAAKDRLIQTALAAREPHPHLYDRWLAQLGAWLVDWGSRLEARYTAPPACCSPAAD
jgi:hypothetical protein